VLRNAQPPGLSFWYRQGPVPLIPRSGGSLGEWVEETPLDVPGTFDVTLDTTGRLRSFLAVRPRLRETKGAGGEPDWRPLIESAGFDPAALRAIDPAWSPPVHAERVVAWSARYPDAPAVEVQLHAASLDGRPVWFRIVEPWTRAAEPASMHEGDWARPALVARGACFLFALIGASWMAIRNVKLGRGDQRTALRFAFYLTAVRLLWFVGAHHVVAAEELDVFQAHLAWSLFRFGVLYVFYLALEPYARRLWPTMLVSWVRLFDGRFRDPLVGRDLLAGVFFGVVFPLAFSVVGRFPGLSPIERWSLEALRGWNSALAVLMATHAIAILDVFMVVILLTVLRVLLRRTWLAIGVISVVGYLMFDPGYGQPFDHAVSVAVVLTIFWLVLFRIGLLAAVAALTVDGLLRTMPLGASTSALLALLVVLAIAAWGFWTSLAGRPLFRDELQEAD
jgi:hypothetical protein